MIITSGLIQPKELKIDKGDLIDIFLEVFSRNKNYRIKGLDSDVIFISSEQSEEVVREVEQQT